MSKTKTFFRNYQVVISGVGGQGVLFITRLLAEAAIKNGFSVFTSETHGMAQRGGTVVSHIKVGNFSSPLIRPGHADFIFALKEKNMDLHGAYLKPGGMAVINGTGKTSPDQGRFVFDCEKPAKNMGSPKSANLILLGYALKNTDDFFCTVKDVKAIIEKRFAIQENLAKSSVKALLTGANNASA